ncbi:MAG TPA: DUF3570 domain-containing protein [Mucilaginibacter sp.]|jgi:hypothetical protein
MRKVYLSVIGFSLLCRFNAWSQTKTDTALVSKAPVSLYKPVTQDSSQYKPRSLRVDEIDLVSSYYQQSGNHSAIQGGMGDESVTDIANAIDINLVWLNNKLNKNTLSVGFGFDYHSAASQAWVSSTGASSPTGTRIYPSLDWTVENAKKGNSIGIGAYYSGEYNYQSLGLDLHFSQKTANKNGEFSAKLQGYFDHVKLIYPSEFIPQSTVINSVVTSASGTTLSSDGGHNRANIPSSPRTSLNASLSYAQMINSRLQVMFLGDVVTQQGYLGLPFHRVYFNTGKDTIEKLPSSRFKLPLGFRLNYFVGDNIILRSYYRYYFDNWGVKSNTVGLEIPYKITPFFSISPFYRYYDQSAAKYFAPYGVHSPTDEYYTSNYEYAKFRSSFYGVGFRIAPPNGVFGWQGMHELEIRYGHYTQTTDLVSDVISLNLGFK